jgi:uncharacterized circularly permuted ATP-grasp superfamily protein/uncharacterized alpha-E superfamily protein
MSDVSIASVPPIAAARGFADYRPLAGCHDEMVTSTGEVRPHWQYLVAALEALGVYELEQRSFEVRRLLRENGVTYNVYGDPQPGERLWPLDPIPVPVTSAEWSGIEQGLIQRAELLDLLLADLYGPRQMIRRGLLPAEIVFTHPGFLRPSAGVPALGRHHLPFYAADLARGRDGVMRVIADRSQAPSGAGYAVENRTVLARVFPSLYRDSHVHRLALFFRTLRAALASFDPRRQDNPRIVLLTPGPENEAYFEHAFLADYLGYTLVRGGDLTVRDNRVWLQALDGPKPVDVILRRVDDAYCDPLELRGDSLLGIPGLLQSSRLGQVAVVNPLGSGVLENPALMAFLPRLASELLAEELRLPSVATWWCGEATACAYVLDNLERLVIKPLAPHASTATVFGAQLSQAEREVLVQRIRAHPQRFVGQEQLWLSTAPVVAATGLEPRPMVLRTFLAAHDTGFVVMPGGLGRVSRGRDHWIVSNQHGGVSKDIWVLASEPEKQVSLLPPADAPVVVTRGGDDVPGRVADDLFWLGRYSERTDATARLLREVLLRMLNADHLQQGDALPLLLRAVTQQTGTWPGFVGAGAEERLRAPERELLAVLLDRGRPGSLRSDIDALVRCGRAVRDRLSGDATRVINLVHRELARPCELSAARDALQRLIIHLAAFAGLCAESMSRGQGWRFLAIGRALERAVHTAGLLRTLFVPAGTSSSAALEALLAVAHSIKTYRRRYRSRLHAGAVLDLVLLDESNPRALAHQLVQVESLAALALDEGGRRSAPSRLALEALTQVRLFDLTSLSGGELPLGAPGRSAMPVSAAGDLYDGLDELLAGTVRRLAMLSDELARRYCRATDAPQQLVRIG